jgi:5-methyltetrahydrofolate--homocysteine methyltransferase
MSDKLIKAIIEINRDEALKITDELLAANVSPEDIIDFGRSAMQTVGEKFETGEYFLPELIVSGDILAAIAEKTKPLLKASRPQEKLGKVVFGTVEGDIHDIAKDIVITMLDINGFEVIDLGVDVPVDTFVRAVQDNQAEIVGLSGFLTLAIEPMRKTISALKEAGLVDVKVMIGGGPINELVQEDTGADGWGANAVDAVKLAKEWTGEA